MAVGLHTTNALRTLPTLSFKAIDHINGEMREPGIEPGPTPWQGAILPLDHSRLAVAEGEEADVPKWLRGSPAKRVCSACAGSNPAVCELFLGQEQMLRRRGLNPGLLGEGQVS